MISKSFKGVVLVLITASLLVQPVHIEADDRDENWKIQISYLKGQLPQLHKNLFFKISKTQWDKSCDDLIEQIPNLKDNQIRTGIMKIVASVGDSHTGAYYYGTYEVYPYEFQWLKEGIFCEAATLSEKDAFCKKLVAIEDKPIDKIIEAAKDYISHENASWLKYQMLYWLTDYDFLDSLGLIKKKNSTKFTFEGKDGKRVDVFSRPYNDYSLIPWEKDSDYQEKIRNSPPIFRAARYLYWMGYVENIKLLYIQYNRCREYIDYRFSDFLADVKSVYQKYYPKMMVVDLRFNTGGNSAIAGPLIDWISGLPLNDPSRLFVIIDKPTYSSAVLNALQFKLQTKATFIGEPTGGKPNSYGEVRTFDLESVKMRVSYSVKYFNYLSDSDPDSLYPDDLTETTSEDYFNGIDPIMDKVILGKVKIPEYKPPPKPVLTRAQKWQQDLDELKTRLIVESKYVDISKADIEKLINVIMAKLPDLSDAQIKLEIQSLIAKSKVPEFRVDLDLPTMPFRLVSLTDGMIVQQASKKNENLLGLRLKKIGKLNVDNSLMLKFRELFPADNFNGMAVNFTKYAIMPDVLKFMGLVEDQTKVELTFEDEEGCETEIVLKDELMNEENTVTLKPYDNPETLPLYMSGKTNYWSKFIDDSKTFYIRMSRSEQDSYLFKAFDEDFDKLYESNYPARFVVDFRGNPGSKMKFANEFIRKIVVKANAMRLPVFVLVDRYTGGSSVSYACMLKNLCKAKIIGECTGTKPNHAGNPDAVVFANEMLTIWVPTESFNFDQNPDSFTLTPDFPMLIDSKIWKKGTDPVLELAERLK